MKNFAFLSFLVSFNISLINGARILGVVLTPSISHQIMFRPIWKELSLRGHELVVLTTDPMNDPSLTNLSEIDLHFAYEIWNKDMGPALNNPEDSAVMMNLIGTTMMKIIEQQLNHTDVQKLINNQTEHFDLVILELIVPIAAALAERFNCPLIGAISLDAPNFIYSFIGNPAHPITNPDINLPYVGKLSFFERLNSVAYNLIMKEIMMAYQKDMDLVIKKYFGEDSSNILHLMNRISLMFVNTNPIFDQIRPLIPNIIQIGGGTHRQPAQPLPKELQHHLDNANQGFIYFSLGSNVKSKFLSENLKTVLLETFAELPYKVLWKFELEDLPGKPDNVIISKWFPQQDIFKHPNIKLFITQGGIQSIDEAIYDYVPMLGLPFFMDQPTNVKRMVAKGLGLSLDYKTLDKQTFKETIQELINNPKYRNRIKELADLASDQPMTGLEKAVWWSEYVIRHKGAKHLRSPVLDIPSYQYYLLDVIGFCLVVIIVAVYLLVLLFRLICKLLRKLASIRLKVKND